MVIFLKAQHQNLIKIKFSHIFVLLTFKSVFFSTTQPTAAIKIKCTNADDFYFTTPGSQCGSYYKCNTKGQKELQTCNRGEKFDFYQQSCSHSPGNCVEPSCKGRSNGNYQDTTHACMRSFTCYAGQLTSLDNCPPKHLHNGQKCVHQDLVQCQQSQSHQAIAKDRRCENNLNDGSYAADSNCLEYIVCKAGEVHEIRKCPAEYLFDIAAQNCVPAGSATACGLNRILTEIETLDDQICHNRSDGAVADPLAKDCASYIMCKNGKSVGQRRCNNQAVFNGETCVPSILHECTLNAKRHALIARTPSDQCQGRTNGYYANPQHGCTSYVRCMAERAVEIGVCPAGQYFDMEIKKCYYERVIERRRCRERGRASSCDGRADGFYVESKCENYYYCHAGHKIEYKCVNGKVFNGRECVPKSTYKCPKIESYDNYCHGRPDDYYKDPNDGCRAYNYCSNGHKITYLCETGYIFDDVSKKCVTKELLPQHNHCQADHICYGKSDGYHADVQSNCRNYVYCKNYEKITQLTCRDGRVFNGQQCVPPTAYACPSLYNHRQVNCVPQTCIKRCERDGFYASLSTDCRDYYFCIGGKSSQLSCPAGKRFNGEICVAEDKFSCPALCTHSKHETTSICPLGGHML